MTGKEGMTHRIPQHIQILQRMQHIPRRHGRQTPQLLHATLALLPRLVRQQIHDRLRPEGAIPQQPQIAERLLRAPELALPFAQLVAEGDEQLAEAHALVLGEGEDARDVVPLGGFFLFREIADEVAAVRVARVHAVEEEGVDVVIQRLVIEEQLAQQAKVATPAALAAAVDLEEGDVIVAVDFVARGVQKGALGAVPRELLQVVVVGEAELADVDHVRLGEGLRVRGEIPGLHLVLAHLDALQVAHTADLGLVLRHAAAGAQFFDLLLAREGLLLRGGGPGGFGGRGGILQVGDV